MSEQSTPIPGTPGTGEVPEPEPEGFREQVIEDAEQERQRKADALAERSKEAKDRLSGKETEETEEPPENDTTSY
jgi:hypothetical protein